MIERDFIQIAGRRISSRTLFAALLVLIPLLYFFPAVIGRVSLTPGDGWTQNIGVRVLAARMLAQGQLPLWNPFVFAGMPLLASVDPGALYPLNWLFLLLAPTAAMNTIVIASYLIALIGTYLFARRTGRSRPAALIAGVIFTFGAYTIAHLAHTHRLTALVWLPWIMLAIENVARAASRRWAALGAIFVALQIYAGDSQTTLYTALLGAAYGALLVLRGADWAQRRRAIVAAAWMALVAALLSAIQLLPQRELLAAGERAQLSYDYFAGYSLPPQQIVTLIFPYFFGGASLPPFGVPYWGEWNAAVTCGYVGLLGLMLALVAVFGGRGDGVPFWTCVALLAPVLAFGAYLPFDLNHLLFRLPVYNLFRGSYRHLYEFTFAAAMLAGIGFDRLTRRTAIAAATTLGAIIVAVAWLYRAAPQRSLAEAEAWVPLVVFALSAATLLLHAQRRSAATASLLLAVLLVDLASFGWYFEWRSIPNRTAARLADPPTLRFIKAREPELHSLRVLSHPLLAYDYAYTPPHETNLDLLNWPDASSARGVYGVNGSDVFRLPQVGAVAGNMDAGGFVQDLQAFGLLDRGFDLLNTKYLLVEDRGALDPRQAVVHHGITFANTVFGLEFKPGVSVTTEPNAAPATELAVVSTMYDSTHLPDGAPVLRLKLHTKDGRVLERELLAGRDTAELAYERADVRANVKHRRPPVVEPRIGGDFQINSYLARLPFERAVIERIEWTFLREDAGLYLVRASLFDATTGASTPLNALSLPPERWRKLERFGAVTIYENLRLLPRAWFAPDVRVLPRDAVLKAIKSGKLNEIAPFDPARTALIATEDADAPLAAMRANEAQMSAVRVTSYDAQHIALTAHTAQTGLLVLSEAFYPGWEARVDGQSTRIYRTNHALRGVVVPPGEHRVEFDYRAPSFRRGAAISALGVVLLLIGAARGRRATGRYSGLQLNR